MPLRSPTLVYGRAGQLLTLKTVYTTYHASLNNPIFALVEGEK